jgi:hypothetical protein
MGFRTGVAGSLTVRRGGCWACYVGYLGAVFTMIPIFIANVFGHQASINNGAVPSFCQ